MHALRDVPLNPSLAVILNSLGERDLQWADEVATAMLGCGVRVLERPGPEDTSVSTSRSAAAATSPGVSDVTQPVVGA